MFTSAWRSSQKPRWRVVVRAAAVGGQVPGFWSREAVEHVCGFGFDRKSLDLHRFDKLSHGLLGLRIWTQQ